jgi:hypothetical protein
MPSILDALATAAVTTLFIGSWEFDTTWPTGLATMPNSSYFSASAIDETSSVVHVSSREGPAPILMLNDAGNIVGSWGEDSISFNSDSGTWGGHGIESQTLADGETVRFWVSDIQDSTVKALDLKPGLESTPTLASVIGTPGVAGSGIDPIQFGSVADVALGVAGFGPFDGSVWVSDGDGGINNRVVRLNTTTTGGGVGATGGDNGDAASSLANMAGAPLWVAGQWRKDD